MTATPVTPERTRRLPAALGLAGLAAALLFTHACGGGKQGNPGPPGPPGPSGGTTPISYDKEEPVPELNVTVLSVDGGTGRSAYHVPGDPVHVTFMLTKADGSAWALDEMSEGIALVSGPTNNINRVLPEAGEDPLQAVDNLDGTYTFTFASLLPATYAPPDNDTASFGTLEGELTGQPLFDGTYSVGLSFVWEYTVEGQPYRRIGETLGDFLVGGSAVLVSREVVGQENCDRCHVQLQGHDGRFEEVAMCLLCHTAGAEDENDPLIAGGTPDVSIDFRVMMHRIHNAAHLPSVFGVSTNPDGSRDYAATPVGVQYVRDGALYDYSSVSMPVMPFLNAPSPRDSGFSSLAPFEQIQEDQIRSGLQECILCHGDPDGAGPIDEPAQGYNYAVNPTIHTCYSCHDDVIAGRPYVANGVLMPPETDNDSCLNCHTDTPGGLATIDGHRHPSAHPFWNPGLDVQILDVVESGTHDSDGTIDPGEQIRVTFTIQDSAGSDFPTFLLLGVPVVVSGPSTNSNVVVSTEFDVSQLGGSQPFSLDIPAATHLEYVGDATGSLGDTFFTAGSPHQTGVMPTVVYRHTGVGTATTLSAASVPGQNYVDVVSSAGFLKDDVIVVENASGFAREWMRIQLVDGDRLWFSSPRQSGYRPALGFAHAAGATVHVATLDVLTQFIDYILDIGTGRVFELSEMGAGNSVLVDSMTPFIVPPTYPPAMNSSGDLGEAFGDWAGKPLVDGTYRVGVWTYWDKPWSILGEVTNYRLSSPPAIQDVLFGSALNLEPYDYVEAGGDSCNSCHSDLSYHDESDRGYETCALCHATSGMGDWPRYAAPSALTTDGLSTSGRNLFHYLHRGFALDNPSAKLTMGQGPNPYPANFSIHFWSATFPSQPGGTQNCAQCHGSTDAWKEPRDRRHPTQPAPIPNRYTQNCGECHDDSSAQAHIAANTDPLGNESCAICHDVDQEWNAEVMHTPR